MRTILSIVLVIRFRKHLIMWTNSSNIRALEIRCYWPIYGNVLFLIDFIPNFNSKRCNFPQEKLRIGFVGRKQWTFDYASCNIALASLPVFI